MNGGDVLDRPVVVGAFRQRTRAPLAQAEARVALMRLGFGEDVEEYINGGATCKVVRLRMRLGLGDAVDCGVQSP